MSFIQFFKKKKSAHNDVASACAGAREHGPEMPRQHDSHSGLLWQEPNRHAQELADQTRAQLPRKVSRLTRSAVSWPKQCSTERRSCGVHGRTSDVFSFVDVEQRGQQELELPGVPLSIRVSLRGSHQGHGWPLQVSINKQSPDINGGAHVNTKDPDVDSGDQGHICAATSWTASVTTQLCAVALGTEVADTMRRPTFSTKRASTHRNRKETSSNPAQRQKGSPSPRRVGTTWRRFDGLRSSPRACARPRVLLDGSAGGWGSARTFIGQLFFPSTQLHLSPHTQRQTT